MMKKITKVEPKLWSTSIINFGTYHYKYKSGKEGDWMQVGFSPRKQAMTLYIMAGFSKYEELLRNIEKFKRGKSCLNTKVKSGSNQRKPIWIVQQLEVLSEEERN